MAAKGIAYMSFCLTFENIRLELISSSLLQHVLTYVQITCRTFEVLHQLAKKNSRNRPKLCLSLL